MLPIKTRYYALLHDAAMVALAWLGAFAVLAELNHIPMTKMTMAWKTLPIVLLAQSLCFIIAGLYRGFWRYVSVPDVIRMLKAVTTGAVTITFSLFLITHLNGFPRSVIPTYMLFVMTLIAIPRIFYRRYRERQGGTAKERILIVGAGEAGHLLVRDLVRNPHYGYQPIAFVDDDANKKGKEVYGVRVLGDCQAIPALVERKQISKVLIAIPTATASDMRRIVGFCKQANVGYRTLPSLTHIATGDVSIDKLHDVSLDDLLGREPVKLDWEKLHQNCRNKTVLVTGGGGSIGREICLQLAKLKPKEIIVVEQSEYNLYQLHQCWPADSIIKLSSYLQDCADKPALEKIMHDHHPEIVFHAAAYKHVPLLEKQHTAAIKNNIIATKVVAEAAIAVQVDKFIFISTDKAVEPNCVMGKTKRVAELLCDALNASPSKTKFITVRFGNVLGSAGSVVPLFKKQIAAGGPVTITHPDMQRFFMTISEACLLILQSSVIGRGGEIFVLDMGQAISIQFLAEQMIQLAGHKPGEDIKIAYTGMRDGEKLSEKLFNTFEKLESTCHPKIFSANHPEIDIESLQNKLLALINQCDDGAAQTLTDIIDALLQSQQPTHPTDILSEMSS